MRGAGPVAALLLALPALLLAGAAPSGEEELDEVLITGEQPGPALWKVSRGDHTLWIMGTLSPLPAKMTWRSKQAERVIGASGEILADSTTDWDADVGFWKSIGLLRAVMRLRHAADGSTLREALPPDVYQRWHAAHRRWFGKDPDPKERARPFYAAELLYARALKASGLSERPMVQETVEQLAKRHKVRIRQRRFPVEIEDIDGLIAELAAFPREKEIACLVTTMDYIDNELPKLRHLAQAWAVGDIAALRSLPQGELRLNCEDALLEETRLGKLMEEEESRFRADWNGVVAWLLLAHENSFTTLPIERLLRDGELLAWFRQQGWTVEEPRAALP